MKHTTKNEDGSFTTFDETEDGLGLVMLSQFTSWLSSIPKKSAKELEKQIKTEYLRTHKKYDECQYFQFKEKILKEITKKRNIKIEERKQLKAQKKKEYNLKYSHKRDIITLSSSIAFLIIFGILIRHPASILFFVIAIFLILKLAKKINLN